MTSLEEEIDKMLGGWYLVNLVNYTYIETYTTNNALFAKEECDIMNSHWNTRDTYPHHPYAVIHTKEELIDFETKRREYEEKLPIHIPVPTPIEIFEKNYKRWHEKELSNEVKDMSDLKKEFQYAIEEAIGDVKLIIDNANEQQLQDVINFVQDNYCEESTLGSWFKRMLNAYLWEKQEKNGKQDK